MRPTEVTIKQGKETTKFKLSGEIGRSLVHLLKTLTTLGSKDESVPASEVFPDIQDPQKRIGIIFRSLRTKNNLTQIELARKLGLDQSDVSKIEKGKRPIGKALAKRIESEFGVDYRRFL